VPDVVVKLYSVSSGFLLETNTFTFAVSEIAGPEALYALRTL
jgi:hypothetical protein